VTEAPRYLRLYRTYHESRRQLSKLPRPANDPPCPRRRAFSARRCRAASRQRSAHESARRARDAAAARAPPSTRGMAISSPRRRAGAAGRRAAGAAAPGEADREPPRRRARGGGGPGREHVMRMPDASAAAATPRRVPLGRGAPAEVREVRRGGEGPSKGDGAPSRGRRQPPIVHRLLRSPGQPLDGRHGRS